MAGASEPSASSSRASAVSAWSGSAVPATSRRNPSSSTTDWYAPSAPPASATAARVGSVKPSRASRAGVLSPRAVATRATLPTPSGVGRVHQPRERVHDGTPDRSEAGLGIADFGDELVGQAAGGEEQGAVLAGPGRRDLAGHLGMTLHTPRNGAEPEGLVRGSRRRRQRHGAGR